MRIGSPARSLTWLLAQIMAVAVLSACPSDTYGQSPPGNYRASGPLDPYGNPMVGGATCYGDDGAMPQSGFTGPFPMGAGGTCPPVGYDLMNDVGVEGQLVDQRGPHYFDVRAEAVYLERDETFGPNIAFTREGVAPTGDIVLASSQLEYDPEPGFRIFGRYDLCPLSVLEFGYMGIFSFDSAASFTVENPSDPNTFLFSPFSNLGSEAAFPGVTDPGGPGPFTERALRHSISIESDLQTAEISYRRYWVGWIPRVSGTLLAGFRYTKLNEEFVFSSQGSENVPFGDLTAPIAALDYTVDADNDLAGFQSGGDIWVGLIQGLRIGAEGKAGLYNNHYNVATHVTTEPSPVPPPVVDPSLSERFRENQPAFIGEASVDLVADVLPSWSIRVGYEVLFINSIVLAGDNFNTGSPYNQGPVDNTLGPLRVPFVADQSEVFYHGGHAGIEFIW